MPYQFTFFFSFKCFFCYVLSKPKRKRTINNAWILKIRWLYWYDKGSCPSYSSPLLHLEQFNGLYAYIILSLFFLIVAEMYFFFVLFTVCSRCCHRFGILKWKIFEKAKNGFDLIFFFFFNLIKMCNFVRKYA